VIEAARKVIKQYWEELACEAGRDLSRQVVIERRGCKRGQAQATPRITLKPMA